MLAALNDRIKLSVQTFAVLGTLVCCARGENVPLWHTQPAVNYLTQGVLLGNGCMGAVVLGKVGAGSIVLNDSSLPFGLANLSGNFSQVRSPNPAVILRDGISLAVINPVPTVEQFTANPNDAYVVRWFPAPSKSPQTDGANNVPANNAPTWTAHGVELGKGVAN